MHKLFSRKPKELIVEITNQCNHRCMMCGIWKDGSDMEFDISSFRRCVDFFSPKTIAITGGEPFMTEKLGGFYSISIQKAKHVNISTNGWFTEEILEFLSQADVGHTSLTFSYDGITSHDQIRGIHGSRKRLMQSVELVRQNFPGISIALKMTVIDKNLHELLETAKEVNDMNIDFFLKIAENIECHYSRNEQSHNPPDKALLHEKISEALNLGMLTNRKYALDVLHGTPKCLPRPLFAAVNHDLFLCRRLKPLGNLAESRPEDIWKSANEIIPYMKCCKEECACFNHQ